MLMAKNILTVDDSASMRSMIKMVLSTAGYNVIEAEDGAKGLTAAKVEAFDMVITDLNMPVMDGMVLIRELRKLPAYKGVPILFLTTESDPSKRFEAKGAGATGWITKPFQPKDLLAVMKKVIGQ